MPDSNFSFSSAISRAPFGLIIMGFSFAIAGRMFTDSPLSFAVYATLSFLTVLAGLFILVKASFPKSENVTITSDVELIVSQLLKNYEIDRSQASKAFIAAVVVMVLGVLVILAGVLGTTFGFAQLNSDITIAAGVVTELVSGIGFALFYKSHARLNATSDKLYEAWRILAAFKKAEDLPDDKKTEVMMQLITRLLPESSNPLPKP